MARRSDYNAAANRVEVRLRQILSIDDERFSQEGTLGKQASFVSCLGDFVLVKRCVAAVIDFDLRNIAPQMISELEDLLKEFDEVLGDIVHFDSSQENWSNRRQNIIDRFGGVAYALITKLNLLFLHYSLVSPAGEFFSGVRAEIRVAQREIENFQTDIKSQSTKLNEQVEKIETTLKESEKLLKQIQANALQVGVAVNAENFEIEAKNHKHAAAWWLLLAAISLLLLLGWAVWGHVLIEIPVSASNIYVGQAVLSKFIVVSVLFFLLFTSAKNYANQKHNEIINRHRHNALSSFMAFVSAAKDDEATKQAVLISATNTIFSNQSSGYIKEEKDPALFERVADIAKAVAATKP